MKSRSVSATHTGLVRSHNEDSFLALDDRQVHAVADGMGGHEAGEVASRIAVNRLLDFPSPVAMSRLKGCPYNPGHVLCETFGGIHSEILAAGRGNRMGTTLTASHIYGDILHVVHAGDSAAYLLRAGRCTKLTEDQTAGARWERENPGEKAHPRAHCVLENCLGVSVTSFLGAQHVPVHLVPGDVVVLCSDGLTGYLTTDAELAKIASRVPFGALADALVQHALDGGGDDNVTVIAVQVL